MITTLNIQVQDLPVKKRWNYHPQQIVHGLAAVKKQKRQNNLHASGGAAAAEGPMPAEFKNKIIELVGPGVSITEEKLIIEKELTETDLKRGQGRLSIGTHESLRNRGLLTAEEELRIGTHDGNNVGSIDGVPLIDPSLERCEVSLRRWVIGSAGVPYVVITKTWNDIVSRLTKDKLIQKGDRIQLWSARVAGDLWFSLVNLDLPRHP